MIFNRSFQIAARNLKEQFEKVGIQIENETAEEKRRQLEEEFERLRRNLIFVFFH